MSIKDFQILSINLEKKQKEKLNLNQSTTRKYKYIFNTKEKQDILNQCSFYKSIYFGLTNEEIFEVVINKCIKQKLYNIKFPEISKEYKRILKLKEDI